MSALKLAVEGIVADFIEVDVEAVTQALDGCRDGTVKGNEKLAGFDIGMLLILFEALLPMIQALIESCPANKRRVTRRLRRPTRRQSRNFQGLVDEALQATDWDARDVSDVALEYAYFCSKSFLRNVIDDCRA